MAAGPVDLDAASGSQKLDAESIVHDAIPVKREIMIAGDPVVATALGKVLAADPVGTEYGPVVRNIPSGTQPISALALPLPANAAKETGGNLDIISTATASIATGFNVLLSSRASEATLLLAAASLASIDTDFDVALSTRASEATLALIKAKTDNLDVALSTRASEATLALIKAKTDNLDVALSTRASEATLALIKAKTDNLDVALSTRASDRTTAAAPFSFRLSDGAAFYDAAKTGQLPAALVGGRLDENIGAWLGSTAPTVGAKASASSIPVVLATDSAGLPAQTVTAGNPVGVTVTNTAGQILASNVSRKSLTITNNGTTKIYISTNAAVTTSGAAMGLLLIPNGGSFTDDKVDTRAWHAIGSAVAASQNLSVHERT